MDKEVKKINQQDEKLKKELAEKYNIKFDNIEQIEIKGKEYFKFVDPKTNEVKMVENIDKNRGLIEQLEESQKFNIFAQGDDGNKNSEILFENERRNIKREVEFIPLVELVVYQNGQMRLTDEFRKRLTSIQNEQLQKEIIKLIEVSHYLDLKSINFEDGLAIGQKNEIIGSSYNVNSGKCDIAEATKTSYGDDTVHIQEEQIIEISDDEIVQKLKLIRNGSNTSVTIGDLSINETELNNYTEYPELVERNSNLKPENKTLIRRIVQIFSAQKQLEKGVTKEKPKILVKRPVNQNKQAAFVSDLLLTLLLGVFLGIALAVMLMLTLTY